MREADGQRHELRRLVTREAEHHPRVTRSAHVDALRDVRRLLVDAGDDAVCLSVEAVLGARVADLASRLAHDARDVDVAVGGDLPHHHREAGGDDCLARDARERVLGQDGVEDRVGDLVGELVGMTLGGRLRREKAGQRMVLL